MGEDVFPALACFLTPRIANAILDMETPDIGAAVLHGEPGQLRLTSTREALAQEQTVAGS